MAEFFNGQDCIAEKKSLENKVSLIIGDVPWGVLTSKNHPEVIRRSDKVYDSDIEATADGVTRYLADTGMLIIVDAPWGVLRSKNLNNNSAPRT